METIMKTVKRSDGQIIEPLTRRERQIAEHVARGLSNRQIGAECGISPETVKRHLASIYGKLAMPGRVVLAIHMLQTRGDFETVTGS
ncbi:MAG TPA: helix-turn-helix transcriptional regulator [Vicinamibacterales bacterium]|nr:helix-turn-helix transcriptional regulator [Vicinamibacterales bacterium]